MTYGEAARSWFRQFGKPAGRAGRPEFWWWQLTLVVLGPVLRELPSYGGPLLALPFLIFLPIALGIQLSVTARRMHDIGRAGSFALLWFVPVAGWVALWVLGALPGQSGPNRFGAPADGYSRAVGGRPGPTVAHTADVATAQRFGIAPAVPEAFAPPVGGSSPAAPQYAPAAAGRPTATRRLQCFTAYGPAPRPELYRAR